MGAQCVGGGAVGGCGGEFCVEGCGGLRGLMTWGKRLWGYVSDPLHTCRMGWDSAKFKALAGFLGVVVFLAVECVGVELM